MRIVIGTAEHFEVPCVVDRCFGTQNAAALIVDFDGILVDPVFDADSLITLAQIAHNFAGDTAFNIAAAEDVTLAEIAHNGGTVGHTHPVVNQARIERIERVDRTEHYVRSPFGFIR